MAADEIEALIRAALPPAIAVAVRHMDSDTVPPLHPLEEACLGPRATERRRRIFSLGRAAAHAALAELGYAGNPAIGRGDGGEPRWPDDVVGTISHSGSHAVAAVGWKSAFDGIGVDLERRSPGLSARGARLVCRPSEFDWVAEDMGPLRRTLLFSAKEAIFKALYPIEHVWLGFGDAELTWQPTRCAFVARLQKAAGTDYPVGSTLDVQCGLTAAEIVSVTYVRARQ